MKKFYTLVKVSFVVLTILGLNSPDLKAQAQSIQGNVTSQEDASGLPGVSVLVKGTSTGTVTDVNGAYQISVPSANTVLVFSFVGFAAKEVPVGNQTTINVALTSDIKSLSEVVVTGYGAQQKKDLTSAVSVVDTKDLLAVPATSFAQQLQGRAAGVTVGNDNTPGGGAIVRIRGYGTLGNNEPLYVIDGVPTKDNLNTINQNDIESIQILKDASSASIYGSRAGNGVVIVTTKKGKSGEPKITFDAYYGSQEHGKLLDLLNTQQYGDYLWQSKRNANVVNATTGNPENGQYGNGPNPVIPDYIVPSGAFEGDPRVDPANYSYGRGVDPEFGKTKFQITKANKQGTNWSEEIFHPAAIQNYQLGATGGTDKGRYAFSLNYYNNAGILKYNAYSRYTIRANTEFSVKKRIRIGENLQLAFGDRQGNFSNDATEGNDISMAYRLQPIIPVYDIMGNFAGSLGNNLGNAGNPVAFLTRAKDNGYKELRVFGNVYGEVDIVKGLTARTSFGLDATQGKGKYFGFRDVENSEYSQSNSLTEQRNDKYTWTWTNTLTYKKTFADVHQFEAFVGLESIRSFGENLVASRRNFFADDLSLRYLNIGDQNTASNEGYVATDWSLFSYFGRINYSFKDKYLLQATLRRDASSRFPATNRYATFPAISAGWRISQESFMQNIPFITDMKLRAGWGQTGNQEIGDYNSYKTYKSDPFSTGYSLNGNQNGYNFGFGLNRFPNPNAKWETSTSTNIGLDFTLLAGKLDVNVDWYTRTTNDLLYVKQYDPKLGDANIPAQNVASIRNRGLDLAINYHGTAGENFRFDIGGNFSTYRNTVLATDPDNPSDFLAGFGTRVPPITRTQAGHPLSSFYGYIVDGIFQSQEEAAAAPSFPGYNDAVVYINGQPQKGVGKFKYRDVNGDGKINADDQTYIGSPHPNFTYGINLHFGYKSLDLTIFGSGVQGNDLFNYVRYWTDFETFQGNRSTRMLNESWRPGKTDAKLPILDANDAISSRPSTYFIEKGSYLRLKNIQLAYTLPKAMISKLGMSQLRVYIQGQNLLTATKYTGMDPDVNLRNTNGGGDQHIGVDEGRYPVSKSFIVGLNVGF